MSLVLERATPAWSGEIHRMLHAVINEIEIYNDKAKHYERVLYDHEYIKSLLEPDAASCVVAHVNGSLAGICLCREDNGPWWLSWFAVRAEFHGRGIGSRLIQTAIKEAFDRKIQKIWCDTRSNNFLSIPILEKAGFSKLCELKNHWCNQDYFLWEKFIFETDYGRQD